MTWADYRTSDWVPPVTIISSLILKVAHGAIVPCTPVALEALAELVRQHIGATTDPNRLHRLGRMVLLADTARLHVDAAALAVETGTQTAAAVARALLAREAVEQACQEGLALAERALGTSAFRLGTPVDLCRRDLAFFLRQANLDGKLTEAAKSLRVLPGAVGDQW